MQQDMGWREKVIEIVWDLCYNKMKVEVPVMSRERRGEP